ncbi:nitrate/nitrite transporter NrtS [Halioxenophilus sp. WMMB6]|uniref:nitrate/nitrite transporter NrtS n=1 Tax=Halioxenophilus sp. WMMB6 TaxID=3073815 RepID=UPI00295EF8E5|nr:nitrate/nitrite transporter NrtS [Halioxenophilus sp. WMMB6]
MSSVTLSPIHYRAIKVALVVGTILATINHGDKLVTGSMIPLDWLKLGLTYLVPYCVSVYSALAAQKRA